MTMGTCETCGNEYRRTFDVVIDGATHTFDSFECAIEGVAPRCSHCGCRIIGHGVEEGETIFCCASCAQMEHGATQLRDHVGAGAGTQEVSGAR
jgi:hypothetical protein